MRWFDATQTDARGRLIVIRLVARKRLGFGKPGEGSAIHGAREWRRRVRPSQECHSSLLAGRAESSRFVGPERQRAVEREEYLQADRDEASWHSIHRIV